MKKIFALYIMVIAVFVANAQQEQQFTQFMYNKLSYNPAYAGSNNSACLTAIHRSQWVGFEGAPNSQLVSFNTPLLNGRVGAGGNISRQAIGIDQRITLDAVYAYRFPLANGNLAFGLQGSIRYRGVNFNDPKVVSTTPLSQDAAIDLGYQSKFLPNFGLGAYYNSQKFYLGASIPRLVKNNLGFGEANATPLNKEVTHAYFMGGFIFNLSSNVKVQPQTIVKIAKNAPTSGEANVNLIYQDRYTVGASYRGGGSSNAGIGEALSFLAAIQATDKLMLAFSYDYSMSEIKNYNSGSFELAVRYCFKKSEGTQFVNPRFF